MAKQTMDAIRQAELNAEQTLRSAQIQANESIAQASEQAEQLIAEAHARAQRKLDETRTLAEQDSRAQALAAQDEVTSEIEALRQQGRKNQSKAVQSVIAEMS